LLNYCPNCTEEFCVRHLKPFSVVGVATDYGLDGPGIESRWGRDFPHLSRPVLVSTQLPVQWVPSFFRGKERPRRDADPSPPSGAAALGGEGSASRLGRSLLPGKTRYPLYRKVGGPQGRSGQVRKISPPPGFDPRTVQPVVSHCTDYATRPTYKHYFTSFVLIRFPTTN
jgi:hypothetical protein